MLIHITYTHIHNREVQVQGSSPEYIIYNIPPSPGFGVKPIWRSELSIRIASTLGEGTRCIGLHCRSGFCGLYRSFWGVLWFISWIQWFRSFWNVHIHLTIISDSNGPLTVLNVVHVSVSSRIFVKTGQTQ